MQDIHWPIGAFGYFPNYTLGAVLATVLDRTRALSLPAGVLLFDYLPFDIQAGDLLAVIATALLLGGLCSALAADRGPSPPLRGAARHQSVRSSPNVAELGDAVPF